MSPRPSFGCPRADAVLALHLDGDLAEPAGERLGYAFVDADSLHVHLRACAACQTALRRARRLDAVLAHGAGAARAGTGSPSRGPSPLHELQARWFAAVLATEAAAPPAGRRAPVAPVPALPDAAVAATPASGAAIDAGRVLPGDPAAAGDPTAPGGTTIPSRAPTAGEPAATVRSRRGSRTAADVHPPAPATRRDPAPTATRRAAGWLAAGTALAAAAAVILWLRAPATAAAATAGAAEAGSLAGTTWSTFVPAPTVAPPPLVAADDAVRTLLRRGAAAAGHAVAQAAPPRAELTERIAAPERPALDRLAATRALLLECRPFGAEPQAAFQGLLEALAGSGDFGTSPPLHGQQLELLRASAPAMLLLTARLRQLDDPRARVARGDQAALVVAARLHDPAIDALVRRVIRRHPREAPLAAAALRCGVRTAGGGALLLDLWSDLANRGLAAIDLADARAWFGAQPGALGAEVAAELRTTRALSRRLQCLLALGVVGDGSTVATLLEHARSRHHDEAHAAAFALGNLPRRELGPLVPLADHDDAFLLRAALARAGHPAAAHWPAERELDADQLRLLHSGSLARFPEVASWFRARHAGAAAGPGADD